MLEIGSVVDGKYKVLNVIGKGGMSVVYLAMNEKANKQWAIKEIMKNDYENFDLNKKEIEMMKKLKHPHLPGIADVIESEFSLLIVMDYIEGRTLEAVFKEQGAQDIELVLAWARQLCDVLRYLHTQTPPIIYRDIKPANVMLKPDGNVMLIDFGAAREFKPQNVKDTISLGTRGYAAPEQYGEEEQSDARTDIYCLGVMLFQLLTGESPYELRPIRDIKPELSSGLEMIIRKCTQVKKEDRYQTAAELLYAIEHYWEFDAEYRKKQKKQLVKFFIPATLTIVFAVCTIVFGFLESWTKKNNYDEYLKDATTAADIGEKAEKYVQAINLNPERAEAYLGILKNCFLYDNILTKEESTQLRKILNDYGNGKKTNESVFREHSEEYGRFAYEAGIAYFYRFEDKTNKLNARGYFEIASAWDSLDTQKTDRARRLYAIADYYSQIGIMDAAGDASVTYLNYWNDLVSLSQGNLVEQDNERTALVMYEEMVSQIVSRAAAFKNDGVLKEDIFHQLNEMKEHLEQDFSNMDESTAKSLHEEIEALKENIHKAEKIVRSTYGQSGQEGG